MTIQYVYNKSSRSVNVSERPDRLSVTVLWLWWTDKPDFSIYFIKALAIVTVLH